MDTNGQLTFNDDDSAIQYKGGIQYIENKAFKKAYSFFKELDKQYGYPYLKDVLKILQFWAERYFEIENFQNPSKKVSFLRELWSDFELYYSEYGISNQEIYLQIERLIRQQIIDLLVKKFQSSEIPDIEALILLGEYFVLSGEIKKAEETFSYANRLSPHNAEILAYLSEFYYKRGDIRQTNILLKEAFRINPEKVPIEKLKSDIILKAIHLTEELGYHRNKKFWIPVIAVCFNIFDVKRRLLQEEFLKLEEECRNLNQLLMGPEEKAQVVKPILMYKYLLLMDSLLADGFMKSNKFVLYERQLRILDHKLYSMYINKVLENGE